MGHEITLISLLSALIVVLVIFALVTGNTYLSTRSAATQLQLGGALGLALIAFAAQSVLALIASALLLGWYAYRLGVYFKISFDCLKHNTKVPHHRRP